MKILDGNAFKLRITCEQNVEDYKATTDMSKVESLLVNFVRRGRITQTSGVDSAGRIVASNSGNLAIGIYGVELTGYYNGAPWRFYADDVFEIINDENEVSESVIDEGVPIYDVTFTLSLGGSADISFVDSAIINHNDNEFAHGDIRRKLGDKIDDILVDDESVVETDPVTGRKEVKFDSDNFGKVDDVKVNGTSVVSQKVANIPVPTKTSDLQNDSDFVNENDMQSALDEKQDKIDTVNLDYQEDGGSPSASASFENGELDISMKNMKMKFSELTAEEKESLRGPQGHQGASAVYNPDDPDVPDFEMANTTGQSTTKAMTQKAVTNELNNINRNIEPIEKEFGKMPYLAKFNGTTSVASCTSIVLQNEGDMLEVEVFIGSISGNAKYALADNGGTSIIFSVTAKSFFARGSDTGRTWMCQKDESLTSSTHFVAKILYDDGKVKFYRDGTLIETYNGQKPMTISRWGLYNNGSTNYYWNGKIGKITIKGQAYNNIGQIPGWNPTDVTIGNNNVFLTDEQAQQLSQVSHIPSIEAALRNVEPVGETFDKIPYLATFNGSNGKASCTNIVLQNNGDSLEVEVYPNAMSSNNIYALANNGSTSIRFSVKSTSFFARADDNTWLCQKDNTLTALSHFTAKIVFEDSKTKFYRDDTLIETYNGQKKITISRWGLYNNGSNDYYWTGKIGRISINGTAYRHIGQIPGWSPTNVSVGASHVFLTDEQYNMLASVALHKIVVIPNEQGESMAVRSNINGNIYASFTIARQLNNDDSGGTNPYEDMWRLTTGYTYRYDDGVFTNLNTQLLVGAENEFAINIQGMGDFTGGYHGNEKIVEEGDYVKFFVDGKAYTFSELAALGTFSCNKFWYEEVTTLFASYSYNTNHLKIGKHFKRTEFVDGGYKTTNYVSFDLSALSVESINLLTAFTGLVCVHKNVSGIITSDAGVEYAATHPSTTVVLASNVDKYSRRLEMRNGNVSCNLDSKLLKSNIDGFTTDMNPNVQIYDRQNDAKYYSYLVNGSKVVSTGKYIATECEVRFLYKI